MLGFSVIRLPLRDGKRSIAEMQGNREEQGVCSIASPWIFEILSVTSPRGSEMLLLSHSPLHSEAQLSLHLEFQIAITVRSPP